MFRYIVLIFIFFSFFSDAGQYSLSSGANFSSLNLVPAGTICGSNIEECLSVLPATVNSSVTGNVDFNKSNQSGVSVSGTTSTVTVYYRKYNKYAAVVSVVLRASFVDDGFECSSNDECFFLANNKCQAISKPLKNFQYTGPDDYTYDCATDNPEQECENEIIQQCSDQLGSRSYSFTDDGSGGSTCSGTCNDGSPAAGKEECNLSNNYCDVADENSDLDFSGSTGSSVDPSNTTTTDEDPEHEIDYEPDGTTSDSSTDMSSLQGDKLINEVVKSRNDNTENLAATTDTTNKTIVEKSDDIQKTISNSADGIIDAVNNATPFYDGNIVDAINGIGDGDSDFSPDGIIDAIDGLGDKIEAGKDVNFSSDDAQFGGWGDGMFGAPKIDNLNRQIVDLKAEISGSNSEFEASLKANVNLVNSANGYQANSLDIGKWGSFDISISRFSEFFGGIGNIIYFLASITALSIVLGGIRL